MIAQMVERPTPELEAWVRVTLSADFFSIEQLLENFRICIQGPI